MRRAFTILTKTTLALLLLTAVFGAFWLGLIPQRWSPFSPLELDKPPGWFTDAKLAAIRRDPPLCRAILKAPYIEANTVLDKPFKNQCGWTNAVRVGSAGGAEIGANPLTCEMAAALSLWVTYGLQPAAQQILNSKVVSVGDFGTYDCRRMIGNAKWQSKMSEHASANALDISDFTLADGRRISVAKHWKGNGPEARFLREAHSSACGYFRVALSPDFNASHYDHFHFDRGLMWTCR